MQAQADAKERVAPMKRRIFALGLVLLLALTLTACAKSAGGVYTLTKATFNGTAVKPSDLGMSFTFTLQSDGTGTGLHNGASINLTWTETKRTVTVESIDGTMVFDKEGKNLILHDEGTILIFERQGDAPEETKAK